MNFFLLLIVVTSITFVSSSSIIGENYRSNEEYPTSESEEVAGLSSEESSASIESGPECQGCQTNYKYTIWIGDNVNEAHSMNLRSECGTTFLNAMKQAAEKREQFLFKSVTHPTFGTFVTQIDGVANDDDE